MNACQSPVKSIITKVFVTPRRSGRFVKHEILTLHEPHGDYSVKFISRDGDRSFVALDG